MSTDIASQFSQPQEVSDLDIAFGGRAMTLMPPYDAIYEWSRTSEARPFLEFQQTWFFSGLGPETELNLKDGIDGKAVLRHLRAIQGSYEPKHEHKEAGVAWLLSQWCTSVKAVPAKRRSA